MSRKEHNSRVSPSGRKSLSDRNVSPDDRCAFDVKAEAGSCFSLSQLRDIAKRYNLQRPERPNTIDLSQNRAELLKSIRDRMRSECRDDELCWLKLVVDPKERRRKELELFKPKIDAHSELDSEDIEYAMIQIQRAYKNFGFMGTVPSDIYRPSVMKSYMKIPSEGKPKIAIILNTTAHGTEGEHWVCLFIDRSTKRIEYYDPLGDGPNTDVKKSIAAIRKRLKLGTFRYVENEREHQPEDNKIDCGVFCLLFIDERLRGRSFDDIISKNMVAKRERFFRLSNS